MADSTAEADVFAVPDFWQTSKWLEDLETQPITSFFSREPDSRQGPASELFTLDSVATDKDGFFKLPILVAEEDAPTVSEQAEKPLSEPEITTDDDASVDLWTQLEDSSDQRRLYRTWDDFLASTPLTHQPAFVSEAGPGVYDALLSASNDPLAFENHDVPVIKTKPYFSSLLALALGYGSALFRKDPPTLFFKPVLPKMRISGYSRDVLQHLEEQCLKCGSTLLSLRAFLQSTYASRASRCGVALASAIEEVIRAVQEYVAVEKCNPRSLLQLQSTVRGILVVLDPLQALTERLKRNVSDEDLMMLVFDHASSADFSDDTCPEIMREVLQRVSRPWIEFVEEWIGTKREDGILLAKSNVGQAKGFVKVEARMFVDDFGEEVEEVDFHLDRSKIPNFIPEELAESIFETGQNLRFIRSSHRENALARWDVIESNHPPKAAWLYDWDQITQLESRIAVYRNSLLDAVRRYQSDANTFDGLSKQIPQFGASQPLGFFGFEKDQIENKLTASMNALDQPVSSANEQSSLGQIVRQRLQDIHGAHGISPTSTPRWSLLPILSFGGIVSAQAQVINRESLKLLFQNHDLRAHLRIQRDFQMLGNGNFCSRLSQALFDPELETAETRRGSVRTGAVMGLRLGGRDTWPPASSELRLALMGVLAESHQHQMGWSVESKPAGSADLPGDLSFAVRDLSPEEIDRCMNPDSLEALDFLRLSYKTPAALTSIITPITLMQYDRIFKHLLRLLRMLYVVNQLFRDVTARGSPWEDAGDVSHRFAFEARHFVCGISAYFMDTGVTIPWQKFEDKLAEVVAALAAEPSLDAASEKLDSPSQLQAYHLHIIDQIMRALFLKKRQQPVLKLLEEIFYIVLLYVKQARLWVLGRGDDEDPTARISQLYRDFKKKVQIFLTVCRGLTEKSQTSSKSKDNADGTTEDGIGEDNKIAQLLLKLDMSGFYVKR